MKKLLHLPALLLFLVACSSAPEPIRYGFDSCDNCKMLIMDHKYGAVIFTKKGKTYKFDDANCVVSFLKRNFNSENDIASVMVVDFSNPDSMIDATSAFYLFSDSLHSPMGSGVAAFAKPGISMNFNEKFNGVPLTWDDLKSKFE